MIFNSLSVYSPSSLHADIQLASQRTSRSRQRTLNLDQITRATLEETKWRIFAWGSNGFAKLSKSSIGIPFSEKLWDVS